MEMTQKIVVLFAMPVDTVDNDTNKPIKGVSLYYLLGDDLRPIHHPNGHVGQRPAKVFMPLEFWDSGRLVDVPGLYDGVFVMTVDSKGKPMLKLDDMHFMDPVRIVSQAVLSGDAPVTGKDAPAEGPKGSGK